MLKEMLGDAYRPEMTHEELDAALAAAGITFDGNELERLKKALSKSNSEAAEYKRQLRAKLSDDEAKAQQEAEERKKMQDDYEALKRENTIFKNRASLLELGYDAALAQDTAAAMYEGDTAKVFACQKAFLEAQEKRIRADVLKATPAPAGSVTEPRIDYQAKINEAMARNDMATAAALMREQQETR